MIRALRQQQNFEIRPFRPRLRGMAAVLERAAGSMDLRSCACLGTIFGSDWGAEEDAEKVRGVGSPQAA